MDAGTQALGDWRRRELVVVPGTLLLLTVSVALMLLGGCSGRASQSPYRSEVVYAVPDDFRLSMLRFERRLEANDIEGFLRTFDPVAYEPQFRDLERGYLEFARRADQIEFTWRISDVRERQGYREFEVPWTMTFVDVLHGHRVERRGVTDIRWSHHVVPRVLGLGRSPLFPRFDR